jgi:hypothetical protein
MLLEMKMKIKMELEMRLLHASAVAVTWGQLQVWAACMVLLCHLMPDPLALMYAGLVASKLLWPAHHSKLRIRWVAWEQLLLLLQQQVAVRCCSSRVMG